MSEQIQNYLTDVLGVNSLLARVDSSPRWWVWSSKPLQTLEERDLVEKIFQALSFAAADTRFLESLDHLPVGANLIVFGELPPGVDPSSVAGTLVQVPGIAAMLERAALKREAWQKLQAYKLK